MSAAIQAENVHFTYPGGVEALRGVSLTVKTGEAVAIIGENGAGKTTLVRHINGLLRPTSGRVVIAEMDTTQHTVAQMASRVGYSFQNPDDQLFERTVRAEIAFGPRNLRFSTERSEQAVLQALSDVGLTDQADSHPYDLPYFERKLIALAATLAMQTPIIVLDEPTTGQDARGVALVGKIIEDLRRDGRTIIAITHDLDFCAEHFSRVVVMGGGKIIADGAADQVLSQQEMLASALVEPPQIVRLAAALGLQSTPLTPQALIDLLKET